VIGRPKTKVPLIGVKAVRQDADHLAPAGMPKRQGIEHRPGSERGDEAVDLGDFDQKAVEKTGEQPEQQDKHHRQRPGKPQHRLQG
jgi:hypothetical protein